MNESNFIAIGEHDCSIVEEHGREWAVCPCGAQFSIDASGNSEQVTDGEEDFHDRSES